MEISVVFKVDDKIVYERQEKTTDILKSIKNIGIETIDKIEAEKLKHKEIPPKKKTKSNIDEIE